MLVEVGTVAFRIVFLLLLLGFHFLHNGESFLLLQVLFLFFGQFVGLLLGLRWWWLQRFFINPEQKVELIVDEEGLHLAELEGGPSDQILDG